MIVMTRVKTLLFFAVGSGSFCFAQGSLTPPGAPGETMKTLAQIEPRTAIASLPYTIAESGSYYLQANLSSTTNGIVIQASNVTLDLMGFSLTGDGQSGRGVYIQGATNGILREVVVHGGTVRQFGVGIQLECAVNSRVEAMTIGCNTNTGLYLYGKYGRCDGNVVTGCMISGNGCGVCLFGDQGQCDGNTVSGCTVNNGTSYGILLTGILGECEGNVVRDCMLRENSGKGVYLYYANGNRMENNTISATTGSSSYGFYCYSTSANLIVRNFCEGQSKNFTVSTSDTYGPLVTDAGALAIGTTSAHPWANFSR